MGLQLKCDYCGRTVTSGQYATSRWMSVKLYEGVDFELKYASQGMDALLEELVVCSIACLARWSQGVVVQNKMRAAQREQTDHIEKPLSDGGVVLSCHE